MNQTRRPWQRRITPLTWALLCAVLLACMLLCVCLGSVPIPLSDTLAVFRSALAGQPAPSGTAASILLHLRLPRVLCAVLTGAALSLCGAAMQGLLRNPLADGSTLGVSSGAALGAAVAMATGFTLPGSAFGGVTVMAIAFAFGSLLLILSLAFALDRSLSTSGIILIGVVFSMFISSVISLVITFSSDHTRSLTFWTLGSFSGCSYGQVRLLAAALLLGSAVLLHYRRELDAFAIGEENARHIGVPVRRVRLAILITVSALIGVCVSVAGTISFVGLIMPHIARMLVGPGHSRLLPASLFSGAIFMLLADLAARTLLSPVELSIGVVTSLVGAVAFVIIFHHTRKAG